MPWKEGTRSACSLERWGGVGSRGDEGGGGLRGAREVGRHGGWWGEVGVGGMRGVVVGEKIWKTWGDGGEELE